MQVEERIRQFIVSSFLLENETSRIRGETSLLEAGVLDSTGVLELVLFLGEAFGIDVPLEDVVPEHFDSIAGLARYVTGHLTGTTAHPADTRPAEQPTTQQVALA